MAIPKLKPLENATGSTKKIIKAVLIGAVALLVGAFGLQASDTDFDLGSLMKGESLKDSKVATDASGNQMRDKEGKIVTNGGKRTNEYNCDDFETQKDAQTFFVNAGGKSDDTNGLDGDNDGEACESNPAGK